MKMYQLLRDNVRSGPYDAESLKEMNLKAFDLIWIEEESIMWKYPSEIKEFSRYAPKAELTWGTCVNSIKERQINYFRECIGELQCSEESMHQPDAFLSDVPEGYEFLVAAENNNRYGGSMFISEEMKNEGLSEAQPAPLVEAADNAYIILGTRQIVDTAEVSADHQQFTSYFQVSQSVARKEEKSKPEENIKQEPPNKNTLSFIAGWVIIVASLFSYLKP